MQPVGSRQLTPKGTGAIQLADCTVGTWGFYTDPVSPEAHFDFFTENLADW